MDQTPSSSGLVVKNTFIDCDVSSDEDDAVAVRKVKSEPWVPSQDMSQGFSFFPNIAKIMRLAIGTSGDVEGAAQSSEVRGADKEEILDAEDSDMEDMTWPGTPEGHFLPNYRSRPSAAEKDSEEVAVASSGLSASSSRLLPGLGLEPHEVAEALYTTALQQMTMQGERGPSTRVLPTKEDSPASGGESAHSSQGKRAAKGAASSSSAAAASNPQNQSFAIAELQELVQSAENTTRFKFPAGVKVLQWTFHARRDSTLAHRAVISFLSNGVPTHFAGEWQPCKKTARRSAAEMALRRLRREDMTDVALADACVDLSHLEPSSRNAAGVEGAAKDHIKKMENFLKQIEGCSRASKIAWEVEQDEQTGAWRALARVSIAGMGHTIIGPALASAEAARAELACRFLWLLGYRSCRGLYVVDRRRWISTECTVPEAPLKWSQVVQEGVAAMGLR
mmetsp:Transcript_36961/g.85252  ORF Transcript_36961/g.85252 Transcript_36961/m.85252 type:complete len:450 (+) Transcript_36961:64-1413(+)